MNAVQGGSVDNGGEKYILPVSFAELEFLYNLWELGTE